MLSGTGLAKPGKPLFYEAERVPIGAGPIAVTAGDLNGDGRPEVVALNAADETLSSIANSWGRLQVQRPPIPVGRAPDAPRIADLNGDGFADVAQLTQYDEACLLYTSPSPRDQRGSRMPSSA